MHRPRRLSQAAKNAILFVSLGIMVVLAFLLALHAWEARQYRLSIAEESRYNHSDQAVIYLDGKEYRERKRLETILLIGLDKFESGDQGNAERYSNDQQSDFLLLLILDHEKGQIIPLHINRDSMAPVQQLGVGGRVVGTVTEQLALSHTYGSGGSDSCRNTCKAVSDFLYGARINHYVTFDMDAVPILNDLVGGVPVEVRDDFSGEDPTLVQGETVCLNGEQAMHYVRARSGMEDSTNLARMERQRQYLAALETQTRACLDADDGFAAHALQQLSEHMSSDCTVNRLSELASDAKDYAVAEIETIPGEAVKGEIYMEFYPDEEAMKELLTRLFFEPTKP